MPNNNTVAELPLKNVCNEILFFLNESKIKKKHLFNALCGLRNKCYFHK